MGEVVRRFYDRMVEAEGQRLDHPYRRFELDSTLRLIADNFPGSGHIIDIGAGPGRYAIEMLRRGYRVTLVDLSPNLIAAAQKELARLRLTAEELICADATDLSMIPDAAADAALLLGPMYHLVDEADRRRALGELRRILKPAAPAIVAYINPWGILRSGLFEFPDLYSDAEQIRRFLGTWTQVGEQRAFTEAAFIPPPQALQELREAGFAIEARAGVEGFASGMLEAVGRIAESDPDAYDTIRSLVADTCDHPAYCDCTEHLHVVVRRLGRRTAAAA